MSNLAEELLWVSLQAKDFWILCRVCGNTFGWIQIYSIYINRSIQIGITQIFIQKEKGQFMAENVAMGERRGHLEFI